MNAVLDATDSQMATLADLVATLEIAESTLSSMTAARDGLLAMAGRLAIDIATQGDHPDCGDQSVTMIAAEIAAVQHVSDRTIERRMAAASMLVDLFPTVWEAQSKGRISAAHSRVIVDAGAHLESSSAREAFAAIVLPLAETDSPNRLRLLARRVAERFAPSTVTERHRTARAQRRVWMTDGEDGMAALHTHAPAALVHGMLDRLSQMAHTLRDENRRAKRDAIREGREYDADDRSVDEIRADLLADLVLSGTPAGHDSDDGLLGSLRGRVEITVPVMTLMSDDAGADAWTTAGLLALQPGDLAAEPADAAPAAESADAAAQPAHSAAEPADAAGEPADAAPAAELDGAMPIDVDTARRLAGLVTGWDRVMTHPVSGRVLAVDRYRPSTHLRRHLRARDGRCRFPGCGIIARKCDLDHNHAASAGGATCDTNLATFCRRHHVLKHNSPWHVEQKPGGVIEWTSPTGRTYVDTPPVPNTVTFRDSADAPAPF
ncbi:HNH endonuclease signature motif containing protein [Microbacterium foliorum]|uniref:DUF222 domain-containing protein n=2 Tax=Microbacterium foliorum TaxID=104336 RepID=A0A0F0KQU2_9MICO|nr:HNH endonuclease signature motif containing protein [Microbacterium foliorum]KJL23223.1 hypothetical protein RN50_01162 [Microbacterium foliorum]